MIVNLYKSSGQSFNITNACSRVTWSGSASASCRQASFDYLNAPYDTSLNIPMVATGDFLGLVDDQEGEVFFGEIFGVERSSQIGTVTFTAYDMMKNLLESKGQYYFKNVTPEAVAAQVCADAQVPVRFLYPTNFNITAMICDGMSLHDIIMAAYTKAHLATGKKFFPMIYKRGFSVYHSKWGVANFDLSDKTNIYESNISESVQNLKNVIKIYDDKGIQLGEHRIQESVQKYGVFQDVYKQEENVDAAIAAYNMLHLNPEQTIRISAIGDINCLSCYSVNVSDGATGLYGRYWISSDEHIWENGNHKMNLELTFEAFMAKVDAPEKEEGS